MRSDDLCADKFGPPLHAALAKQARRRLERAHNQDWTLDATRYRP